jgi:AAA domain
MSDDEVADRAIEGIREDQVGDWDFEPCPRCGRSCCVCPPLEEAPWGTLPGEPSTGPAAGYAGAAVGPINYPANPFDPPGAELREQQRANGARPATLQFQTVKELCARVDAAGPRQWLLRGIWPAGDYGIHAGEMKSQKSWNVAELVVAVASGRPWLGLVDVGKSGPVLMFTGEGGEADLVRRLRAVAQGTPVEDLPITICFRAPHLSSPVHLGLIAAQLDRVRPVLTSIDPAYLALRGANGADLYAMGAVLEAPQHLCQEAGSALVLTTHHNRSKGRGAGRITGAGPAEWGRVLINTTVISRRTDPATQETTVISELDIIGGSVPDRSIRLTRRIRADDPDDLDSRLAYRVSAQYVEAALADTKGGKRSPAGAKLLDALRAAQGMPRTVSQLVDAIAAKHGHGLTRETCSRELNKLAEDGLADRLDQQKGRHAEWIAIDAEGVTDV